MFFRILFVLACYNLYKAMKSMWNDCVLPKKDGSTEISTGEYISMGATAIFYAMVMAICAIPSLLF